MVNRPSCKNSVYRQNFKESFRDGDAASGAILSLGASTLSLNGGRLHLESGNAETPASVEASGQPFAAGTWHHVAVALGTENVSLYAVSYTHLTPERGRKRPSAWWTPS